MKIHEYQAKELLRQYQVERGDVIGVLADRSELLVLGLLGVLFVLVVELAVSLLTYQVLLLI